MKGLLVLALFGLAACDSPAAPRDDLIPTPTSPSVDEANLLVHLGALADDSMAGRQAGSSHETQAAAYLRDQFMAYALGPGTPGYLQHFQLPQGRTSQNVLAILPGHGSLARQWVVIGAHYDHVGFTQVGPDSVLIYNGADDNASGTALLLEIARSLSTYVTRGTMTGRDRRSVLFQAYGAEELGLVGSTYFCGQPTIDMDSVAAMLNLDMVGRYAQNGLWTIGSSSSADWMTMLDDAGASQLATHGDNNQLLGASDQYCFFMAQIPVLFFHTGLHGEYHTPRDDVALIDTDGMVTVGNLVTSLLAQLLVRQTPPIFSAPRTGELGVKLPVGRGH